MKGEIVTLTEENLHENRAFCGLSGRYLEGHAQKIEWLKARWKEGLRYQLYKVDGKKRRFHRVYSRQIRLARGGG